MLITFLINTIMKQKFKSIALTALLSIALTTGVVFLFSGGHEKEVYVCMGPQSKRYHKTKSCKGIKNCSKDIKKMSISEAESKRRTPCGYCFGGEGD